MSNEIIKLDSPELQTIEASKAEQIKATFEPMAVMLTELESVFNEVITESEKEITPVVIVKAKRLRLDISKIRIATEKARKTQKEEYLRAGKAIDGVSNILKWAVVDKENKLKDIEDHFVIQEQKRVAALQTERADKLLPYIENAHDLNLSGMENDVWLAYYNTKKKEHNDMLEAERVAEAERIAKEKAEAEEQKRIREENEQLKKDAEEKDRLAKIAETARAANAEAERKKQAAHEAELNRNLLLEREARKKVEREERAKREKLEAALKAKEEAERAEAAKERLRIQSELNKGDADKVKDLISDLESIMPRYAFASARNKEMYVHVNTYLIGIINHIKASQE